MGPDQRTPAERHRAMTWAQRLKRVFGIEIESCEQCGGKGRVMATIEDRTVIGQILGHLASRELPAGSRRRNSLISRRNGELTTGRTGLQTTDFESVDRQVN